MVGQPRPLGALRIILTVQRHTDNTKEVHNVIRWQSEAIIRQLAVNTRRKAKDLLSRGSAPKGQSSKPGGVPNPHLGHLKMVRFARIHERRYRVFIMKWRNSTIGRKIPGVLERGGTTTIKGRPKKGVGYHGRISRKRRVRIMKRPSLVPALRIERKKLPQIIRRVRSRDAREFGTARRKLTPIVNRVGV